ncbi:MAG: signal peptidase II [bacterium]|nr:signal peptidase II [bacterium]
MATDMNGWPRLPRTARRVAWGIARVAIVTAFVGDMILKFVAQRFLLVGDRCALETAAGLVGFVPSVNSVFAFSLPVPNAYIWPLGWVIVAFLVRALFRSAPPRQFAVLAVLFGAVSNLTERTFLGGVTDYLALTNLFPAFNIADVLVMVGVAMWLSTSRSAATASVPVASQEERQQ